MASETSKKSSGKKSTIGPLVKLYLFLYNAIQTAGWSYLLYQTLEFPLSPKKGSLYEEVSWTVIVFQNLAVLEIVNAALKFVPSSVQVTIQQVSSRVILVCGALMISNAAQESMGFPLLLLAWSITEIIRYSSYALNIANITPYFLTYLRYTTFYALYPIGVTGELLCLYATYKEVQQKDFRVALLGDCTVYYPYVLMVIMFLYIPLFPQMYLHMIKQRRKVLGRPTETKTK